MVDNVAWAGAFGLSCAGAGVQPPERRFCSKTSMCLGIGRAGECCEAEDYERKNGAGHAGWLRTGGLHLRN